MSMNSGSFLIEHYINTLALKDSVNKRVDGVEVGLTSLLWDRAPTTMAIHYQKFAKYQRIYRRNNFCRYFEVKITDGNFPSVIQSVKTDENFSVRNSVGQYRRKFSVGILSTELRTKKFPNLKTGGSLT